MLITEICELATVLLKKSFYPFFFPPVSLFHKGSIAISTDCVTGKLSTTNFQSTMYLKDSFDCRHQDHNSRCLAFKGFYKATLTMEESLAFCEIYQFSG